MISDKAKLILSNILEKEEHGDAEIIKAEQSLNVKFSSEYKWLLNNYGFVEDDNRNVISGIGAYDQAENVLFLNKKSLKVEMSEIETIFFAISYTNKYSGILVMKSSEDSIYWYSYDMKNNRKLFDNLSDLLVDMYS